VDYCKKCGNTGEDLNGNPCDCQSLALKARQINSVFVPTEYIGITFDKTQVTPVTEYYASDLESLYHSIVANGKITMSQYIASPPQHSKTLFVYSILQALSSKSIPIFPYLDIDEIARIIFDIDRDKASPYLKHLSVDPTTLYEVPVLFVKVPLRITPLTHEALYTIIDRRKRRGLGTIATSYVPWNEFVRKDFKNTIKSLSGNGQFNSIKIRNYFNVSTT